MRRESRTRILRSLFVDGFVLELRETSPMRSAPHRFILAVLWPISVWGSFGHFDKHGADDYVARTSPIIAFAIGFWVCFAGYVALTFGRLQQRMALVSFEDIEFAMPFFDQGWQTLANALMFFLPLLYIIGLWMFTAREERFPE
jgi:hypothetical protein